MFTIDSSSYDKAAHYPQRHGYQLRGTRPTSIVIHSTNNSHKNTPFDNEAKYLFESADVGAHYLVGKGGALVQFLDPRIYQAWHAGVALAEYQNARSIGVELHHSVHDPPYPAPQIDALTWLVRDLMARYHIPITLIDTHRAIALPGPNVRKHDPNDWSDEAFYAWREALAAPTAVPYRVRHTQAIFESPDPAGKIALDGQAELRVGETVLIDEIAHGGWAHLASGLGFVPSGVLETL